MWLWKAKQSPKNSPKFSLLKWCFNIMDGLKWFPLPLALICLSLACLMISSEKAIRDELVCGWLVPNAIAASYTCKSGGKLQNCFSTTWANKNGGKASETFWQMRDSDGFSSGKIGQILWGEKRMFEWHVDKKPRPSKIGLILAFFDCSRLGKCFMN